jgi:PPOX class probable FMN-dependent enzyme
MSLAPWRSPLSRALHLNRSQPYSRYLQLATIRADGKPANRTVVFRGFLENTNQLQIITDIRSEKISQIEENPWGEACWYFIKTREQFRLLCQIVVIASNTTEETLQKARKLVWHQLSDNARSQFTWSYPGKTRIEEDDSFSSPLPSSDEPLTNFCLLLLDPEKVDHLELRGNPQNRWQYTLNCDLEWNTQQVNP